MSHWVYLVVELRPAKRRVQDNLDAHAQNESIIRVCCILVPRAHDPSGLWQGSRALALSNTGSPRFTDFPSNLANLIG